MDISNYDREDSTSYNMFLFDQDNVDDNGDLKGLPNCVDGDIYFYFENTLSCNDQAE